MPSQSYWPNYLTYLDVELFQCALQRHGIARKVCGNGIMQQYKLFMHHLDLI